MWPWTLWRQRCKNPEWFVYYPVNSQSRYRQREAWQRWKSCCLQKPELLSFQRRFVHLCWVFVSLLLARLSLLMYLLGRIRWMQCTDATSCCRCSVICVAVCLSVESWSHGRVIGATQPELDFCTRRWSHLLYLTVQSSLLVTAMSLTKRMNLLNWISGVESRGPNKLCRPYSVGARIS